MKPSFLYVGICGRFVKIGCTSNPRRRLIYMLRAKSNGISRPSGVIGLQWDAIRVVYGTEAEELELHGRLEKYRIVGEWFDVECLLDPSFIDVFGSRQHVPVDIPMVKTSGWKIGQSNPLIKLFTPLCGVSDTASQ